MRASTRRLVRRLLAARGLQARALGDRLWLVHPEGRSPGLRRLSPGAWLVLDRADVRRRMRQHQLRMGAHLCREHLAWLLRELEVTCVLDVGANRGQFAQRLRRGGYTGRIVSFEPVAHVAEELRRAAADDPEWHVHQVALGQEPGGSEIHVASGPATTSSLLEASDFGRETFAGLAEEDHVEEIRVRRLDEVWDEAVAGLTDPRVFLKMDTQGYDLRTLRGAGARVHDIVGLQSEVSVVPIYEGMPRLPEQLTEYEAAGFEVSGMFPVTMHAPTLRTIEFDLLMVRPEALTRPRVSARPG